MSNINPLKHCPFNLTPGAALPWVMPTLNTTPPPSHKLIVLCYSSSRSMIGWCEVEAARKYIYSGLVYKTRKAYCAARSRKQSLWQVKESATGNVAMIMLEKSFQPIELLETNDQAGRAKLFQESVGKQANFVGVSDTYNLYPKFKFDFAEELANAKKILEQKYNRLIAAEIQDIIDGAEVLKTPGLEIEIDI